MKQLLPAAIVLLFLASACIPREQYQAMETERNYYRNQVTMADSMADLRAISTYDQVDDNSGELETRIRQIEALTATNVSLNNSYQALQERYDQLLSQSQTLLSENGNEVTALQQRLAERTTAVAQQEAELRQLRADLEAREQAIDRIEQDYAPAGGGQPSAYGTTSNAPVAYGTQVARGSLNDEQALALRVNELQNGLAQTLVNYPATAYSIDPQGDQALLVTLDESLLTGANGFLITPSGSELVRSLAATLRNYAGAEITVIGHTDNQNGNALRAYEDSSDRAINVVQQLINFGVAPRQLTVGAKGFYDPVSRGIGANDMAANRRTELLINLAY